MESQSESAPTIVPVYSQSHPNETIALGQVELGFESKGKTYSRMAQAELRFRRRGGLRFKCELQNEDYGLAYELFDGEVERQFGLLDRGVNFRGFCVGAGGEDGIVISPNSSAIIVTPPVAQLSSATFHLFNFPEFHGSEDYTLTTGEKPHLGMQRCGRAFLRADGWVITISSTVNTRTLVGELEESGGFVITHVGKVEREDGTPFNSEELEDCLTCLQYFISFVLGRWSGVAFPVGYDVAKRCAYERWGMPIVADGAWKAGGSWFDSLHGELLGQVYPGFVALWKQPTWSTPLSHALYWYLGACDRRVGVGVDTGLILAQTALEGLAWTHCVIARKMVSRNAFSDRGGLRAPDKLRLLISSLDIPTAIPAGFAALHANPGRKWEDGLDAITGIRNSLVHADAERSYSNKAYFEAWSLSLWYIEMVLLRLSGHVGKYADRTTQKWAGQVADVPWK